MARNIWLDKIAETARALTAEAPSSKSTERNDDLPFRTVRKPEALKASSVG